MPGEFAVDDFLVPRTAELGEDQDFRYVGFVLGWYYA